MDISTRRSFVKLSLGSLAVLAAMPMQSFAAEVLKMKKGGVVSFKIGSAKGILLELPNGLKEDLDEWLATAKKAGMPLRSGKTIHLATDPKYFKGMTKELAEKIRALNGKGTVQSATSHYYCHGDGSYGCYTSG